MPKDKKQPDESQSFLDSLLAFPRTTRIIIAAVFALALTLAISPVIDRIYLGYFFTEDTRSLPALISGGAGLLMYGAGWLLLVGMVGEQPTGKRLLRIYLLVGMLSLLIILAWAVRLVILGGL